MEHSYDRLVLHSVFIELLIWQLSRMVIIKSITKKFKNGKELANFDYAEAEKSADSTDINKLTHI